MNARRLQKKTAIRAIRTFDLQSPSVQPLRILICREISAIKAGTHPNIRNIIDIEGVDIIRVSLEPIIGMSLRDILQKNTLFSNQISHLCSKVRKISYTFLRRGSDFYKDSGWAGTFT